MNTASFLDGIVYLSSSSSSSFGGLDFDFDFVEMLGVFLLSGYLLFHLTIDIVVCW